MPNPSKDEIIDEQAERIAELEAVIDAAADEIMNDRGGVAYTMLCAILTPPEQRR